MYLSCIVIALYFFIEICFQYILIRKFNYKEGFQACEYKQDKINDFLKNKWCDADREIILEFFKMCVLFNVLWTDHTTPGKKNAFMEFKRIFDNKLSWKPPP